MDDIRFPPRGSEDASPALALQGLCKAFGQKIAVNMLSLTVPTGSIYGMVGPNGAGKTTTLSMATGLLVPDAGRAAVHGTDVWTRPGVAKARLGVLPDGLRTFDRLTGLELITYAGLLRGLERDVVVARSSTSWISAVPAVRSSPITPPACVRRLTSPAPSSTRRACSSWTSPSKLSTRSPPG